MQQGTWDEKEIPSHIVPVTWGYLRPTTVPTAELLVEEKVGAELGWRLPIFRGLIAATDTGGSGAFRLIAPATFLQTPLPAFEVLRLRRWSRFGNAFRQLKNIFHVAEEYGVKQIELPSPHEFFEGAKSGQFGIVWMDRTGARSALPESPERQPGLTGDFFIIGGLGLSASPEAQAHVIAQHVRPLLKPRLRQPDPQLLDGDVVLHFRAGDVFGQSGPANIHRGYGQPPAAYYLAAVARERPSRVWIVYEDTSNPAVEEVESVLRKQGVEVRTQSSQLEMDLKLLLNARCLVASFGSFCLAVAALSTRIRKLYQFGPPIAALQRLGVGICEAIDVRGDYRRAATSDNWTASPAQLALMIAYPQDAIAFVEHPPIEPEP
jgi:hypothetical protein